jgi:hypothetical protein
MYKGTKDEPKVICDRHRDLIARREADLTTVQTRLTLVARGKAKPGESIVPVCCFAGDAAVTDAILGKPNMVGSPGAFSKEAQALRAKEHEQRRAAQAAEVSRTKERGSRRVAERKG